MERINPFKPLTGALLAIALFTGCGDPPAGIRPLPPTATVLAFGDSLTRGKGARQSESYPSQLADLLGVSVINEGISGEESDEGLNRLPDLLDRYRPNLVLLCHGGNDFLRLRDKKGTHANLRKMIQHCRDSGADVILIAVPDPGLTLSPPGLYKALASEFAIPLEADIMTTVISDKSLLSDHVHPNATGYRHIAEALAKTIRAAEAGAHP